MFWKKKEQLKDDFEVLKLKTYDHHDISVSHYQRGYKQVIILAHGFFNNKDVYLFKCLARDLAQTHDVITFDFRGHGKSSGLFEWTTKEDEDTGAVVRYAREQGYARVGLMGFSLGAAVALITASHNKDIDSLIAVSAPYDFWKIDYHFWEPEMLQDLKLNIGYKGFGKSIRPGNPFSRKIKPIDVVEKISPMPVLFIHGDKDWLIKPEHSEKLFAAALEPKKLVMIHNAGHAEKIYDTHPKEFVGLCQEWFKQTLKS